MKVTIAPDFQSLLNEHAPEELAQLEENCLSDPKHERMPPVLLWANAPKPNTIVDGHHQHAIRTKHRLTIKYAKLDFESRQEAKAYAFCVQLGRRNWSQSQRAIALAEYTKLRRPQGRPTGNSVTLPSIDKLAETAGVGTSTMGQAAKVSDTGAAAIVNGIKRGDFSASDAASVTDLPKAEQVKVAAEAKREGTTLRKARESVAPKPKPKRGQPTFDVRKFRDLETALGKCIRLNSDLKEHCGGNVYHAEIKDHLNESLKVLPRWRKGVKA